MTVIPFPVFRFTPADVAEFYGIALPRCSRGLWSGIARQTGRDFDRMMVSIAGVARPVFRFERSRDGRYRLFYHDAAEPRLIGSGASARECLTVWRTRSDRKARQPAGVEQAV